MDIAFGGAASGGQILEAARTLEQSSGSGTQSNLVAMPMSQAYPTQGAPDVGLSGAIDRVRADFEAFRLRLERQKDPQAIDQNPRQAMAELSESMDRAVRTQVNILELGLALNAGLTATQQSQNSVKTLLEKS